MEKEADTFLFYLGHPAHYHNISIVIQQLSAKGFRVVLVARAKDVLFELLVDLPYEIIYLKPRKGKGKLSLIKTVISREFILLKLALKYQPKMLIGTDIVIAHIGKLLTIPSVILNEDDAKQVPFLANYGFKFASAVFSPNSCDISPFKNKLGYNGYHELAYLHPNYFKPNKSKISKLLIYGEKYFILRFAELSAHHDKGKNGIDLAIAKKIIAQLTPFGRVYITSERKLELELEPYRIFIAPKDIHHALSFAQMYIGDSQTMAAEAAVLGTPSIRFNDFVGKLGYLEELEHKYQLTYGIPTVDPALLFSTIKKLLARENLKSDFKNRKDTMLKECVDVAQLWTNYFIKYRKK
jgi:predicted glycosyltransferase